MEKSIIEKADNAHKRREQFLKIKNLTTFITWQLAFEIWKNKDWGRLGFESMRDYFEAPKESGGLDTSRSYMITLAESWQYGIKSGLTTNQMKGLKPNKLYYLAKIGVKDPKEIKAMNDNNSVKDLMLMSKKIEPEKCEHENLKTIYYCPRCKSYFPYDPRK
jgi:competence CoiA-like predicted nuclease